MALLQNHLSNICQTQLPSEEKTLGPTHCLGFLGIIHDFVKMQASLPPDKLAYIREYVCHFSQMQSVTKRELRCLLGHLNFAMCIIPQSYFISSLLDLSKSTEDLHKIVLEEGCRSSLKFWLSLLNKWNAIPFFCNDHAESAKMKTFTDTAPSNSFGGIKKKMVC